MSKTLKLAIIGCGGMAGGHLRSYLDILQREPGSLELAAMCDDVATSAENFAHQAAAVQGTKPNVYTDFKEMLEKEPLDGADICTPHSLHHVAGVACLDAGVNVIIEKPIGITIKASKLIIEAARRNGKIAATAENIRRGIHQRTSHWAITQEKILGDMRLFFAQHASYQNPQAERQWHWRIEKYLGGGGMVMDSGAHYCDTIRYLFGDVDTVYARVMQLEKWPHKKGEQIIYDSREDTWIANLTFKSGMTGTWSWTMCAPGHSFTKVVYHGSRGALVDSGDNFHGPFGGAVWSLIDGSQIPMEEMNKRFLASLSDSERKKLFPYEDKMGDGVFMECYDFVDAIRNNRPPDVDATTGMKAKAISESIFESSFLQKAVKYDDVLSGKIEGYQKEINDYLGI